jgi:hypothetical protein
VVEASVLALVDLAHLPVLVPAEVLLRRAQEHLLLALLLWLLAKAVPPVAALRPVAAARAVLAHLVVEAAAPVELLRRLLSHQLF